MPLRRHPTAGGNTMRAAIILLAVALLFPASSAWGQCTSPVDLGPGEDVAVPTVGAIFAIVGPPAGFVVGARAEVSVDAPPGESADNWSIALVGFDLITDSG